MKENARFVKYYQVMSWQCWASCSAVHVCLAISNKTDICLLVSLRSLLGATCVHVCVSSILGNSNTWRYIVYSVHKVTMFGVTCHHLPTQGLGVVPAEEWDQFMSVIRKPLPSTFRITGTRHLATAVRQCLQHTFFTQLSEAVQRGGEGEGLAPPTPLPWSLY